MEQHKAYRTSVDSVITLHVAMPDPGGADILIGEADMWMEHRKRVPDNETETLPVDISSTLTNTKAVLLSCVAFKNLQ